MNQLFDAYVARVLKKDLARYSPPEDGRARLLQKAVRLPRPAKVPYETGPSLEPLDVHGLYHSSDWTRLFSNWTRVYSLETGIIGSRMAV